MMKNYRFYYLFLALMLFIMGGTIQAQTDVLPSISITDGTFAAPGGTGRVIVSYDAGDKDIVAIAFSIDYDETILTYDSTVEPFACLLSSPYICTFAFDAGDTAGELDFTIESTDGSAIPNGNLVQIPFIVEATAALGTVAEVNFSTSPQPTYGNSGGTREDGQEPTNGSILVTEDNNPPQAVDDILFTAINTGIIISPIANDIDPEGDALTLGATGTPSDGTLSPA